MRVLFVCTANICRSPSGAQLLRDQLGESAYEAFVVVGSAGVMARVGDLGCEIAPALQPDVWEQHSSRPLTAQLVRDADLVLVASREHRPAVVAMDISARRRTFTIVQAGRIGAWLSQPGGIIESGWARAASGADTSDWADQFPAGDPRSAVPAVPEDLPARWGWLVTEMDAARGIAAVPASGTSPPEATAARIGLFTRLRSEPRNRRDAPHAHPDDLVDPHVAGSHLHQQVDRQLREAVAGLVSAMMAVSDHPRG